MLSLGAYPDVSLRQARERHDETRRQMAAGINPSAERRASKVARALTFKAVSLEFLEQQKKKLTDSTYEKSRWLLEDQLCPWIGNTPIANVEAPELLSALRRIEARGRYETAHRAKQKAGQVFRYAIATGRARHNPAADLREALAPVVTKHRAAVTDPLKIGELMRAIDGYSGQPSTETALKLAPLLFVRPGELRYARWEEFDLEGKEPQWRIPGGRMKMREAHVVPLSHQAITLLENLYPITGPHGLLFPSLTTVSGPRSRCGADDPALHFPQ